MYINPHILDVAGSFFGLTSTVYSIKNKSLTWPTSLIAICIGIVLYFHKGLYGDTGLHIIYFVLALYGWFQWQYGGKNRSPKKISHLSIKLTWILGFLLLLGISALATFLHFYTDSKVPIWDATSTMISLMANFLMCRRIIQCWHLWFVADGLFAGMYFYKDIPVHGLMYTLYVGLAIAGYLNWKKQKANEDNQALSLSATATYSVKKIA